MHSVTHFFIMFLGDYALMLAHLGVRSYGCTFMQAKTFTHPCDKSCIYPGYNHI